MSKRTGGSRKQEGGNKNKQEGGNKNKQEGGNKNKQEGGKRKTHKKMAKGASDWNKKVMEIYRTMKKRDASVKLGAAMKEASRLKKAGKL
jgi:hypothetical protein